MADNLESVSQQIKQSNDVMEDVRSNTEMTSNYLRDVVDVFSSKLNELVSFMRGNQLDKLEERREDKKKSPSKVEAADDSYIKDMAEKVGELASRLAEILGITAGIIFSPFVVIGAFFKELGVMTKRLDALMKGGLSRFFSPIISLFNKIANSKLIQGLVKIWTKAIVPFFRNVGQFFGLLDDAGKAAGAFGKIVRTAGIVGTALAKVSGVLTILIGAFEFITGFIEGFNRGGLIEGLKQGIVDVYDSLIGSFTRLTANIVGFLFKSVGLENFGNAFQNLGSTITDTIITVFKSAVDLVVGLFTLDFDKIKSASIAGGGAIIKLIAGVADAVYGLIRDLFSFAGISLPDLNFGEIIRTTLASLEDIIISIVTAPFRLFEMLRDLLVEKVSAMAGFLVRFLPGPLKRLLGIDGEEPEEEEKEEEERSRSRSDDGELNPVEKRMKARREYQEQIEQARREAGYTVPEEEQPQQDQQPSSNRAVQRRLEQLKARNARMKAAAQGEDIGSTSSPSRVAAGDELQQESEARRDAERNDGRRRGESSGGVNVATNIQNNSNTTTQTRPSASSQPDNMSDTMILAGA